MKIKYLGGPGEHDEEDLRAIYQMQVPMFNANIESLKSLGMSHWWAAKDGDVTAAFAGIYFYSDEPTTGFLNLAGVLPAYRGLGLHTRLIRVREKRARMLDADRIITYTAFNPIHARQIDFTDEEQHEAPVSLSH